MSLAEKYPKEVEKILAKYPPEQKRSAVMPLLYMAQREEGYVDRHAMQDIASMLEITETEVASIIGFYTLYHDKLEGQTAHPGLYGPALCSARCGPVPGRSVRKAGHRTWRNNAGWPDHGGAGHVPGGLR